jgi:hypothetical protein
MLAAPRDFVADEFRRHEGRDRGAKTLAIGESRLGVFEHMFPAEIFPRCYKNHFLRDDAGMGKFVLGDQRPIAALARPPVRRAGRHEAVRRGTAIIFRAHRAPGVRVEPLPGGKPGLANPGKPFGEIDRNRMLRVGSGWVVDPDRRLVRRRIERDLPKRNRHVCAALRMMVNLFRARQRPARHASRKEVLGLVQNIHRDPPLGVLPARQEADAKRPEAGLVFAVPVPALVLSRFRFYGFDLSRRFRQHPWRTCKYKARGGIGQAGRKA